MQPRKLKVVFATFPYGGNGQTSAEHPDIRNWLIPLVIKANRDERIQPIEWVKDEDHFDISDTPITMTRNAAIEWARQVKADVLVMVDSDNTPDIGVGIDPLAKPFFETSFDFLYKHWDKGPVIIGAPYCGPPVHPRGYGNENVYVFLWRNFSSTVPVRHSKLDQYTREEAAQKIGIEPVAALPTGCIMYDMRVFDLIEPPYFEYRYEGDGEACKSCGQHKKGVQAKKNTTEDVFLTRDLSLAGCEKLGYNPVLCNWDAWAGHWKPHCVGKPVMLAADQISESFVKIVKSGTRADERLVHVQGKPLPRHPDQPNGPEVVFPAGLTVEQVGKVMDGIKEQEPAVHNTDEADMNTLRQLVVGEATPKMPKDELFVIVEVGSWLGASAVAMSEAINNSCPHEIHCVDHWEGGNEAQRHYAKTHDVYEEFLQNTEGRHIIPHRGQTTLVGVDWTGRLIDLLFVDAGHSYDDCLSDISAWLPHVRPGGLVCGHDYSHVFPGVKQAVHEAFGFEKVMVIGTMWFVRINEVRNRIAEHAGVNGDGY